MIMSIMLHCVFLDLYLYSSALKGPTEIPAHGKSRYMRHLETGPDCELNSGASCSAGLDPPRLPTSVCDELDPRLLDAEWLCTSDTVGIENA